MLIGLDKYEMSPFVDLGVRDLDISNRVSDGNLDISNSNNK